MNNCLNCGKPVINKFCNVSCQNIFQSIDRKIKRYGNFVDFDVTCFTCDKIFKVNERELLHPQKDKYYCSRSCANKRNHSQETKDKISNTLINPDLLLLVHCEYCNKEFIRKLINQRFCGQSCSSKSRFKSENLISSESCRRGGLASVKSQGRRSKNEILFSELCINEFKTVLCNEQIFNGWDADVIIEDFKLAILWNGVWHYKQITKDHSLKQTNNRDIIKTKEIINSGYVPYVIRDMGKFNKDFVIQEFEKLKIYCGMV